VCSKPVISLSGTSLTDKTPIRLSPIGSTAPKRYKVQIYYLEPGGVDEVRSLVDGGVVEKILFSQISPQIIIE